MHKHSFENMVLYLKTVSTRCPGLTILRLYWSLRYTENASRKHVVFFFSSSSFFSASLVPMSCLCQTRREEKKTQRERENRLFQLKHRYDAAGSGNVSCYHFPSGNDCLPSFTSTHTHKHTLTHITTRKALFSHIQRDSKHTIVNIYADTTGSVQQAKVIMKTQDLSGLYRGRCEGEVEQ